jgi:hypothetical protein
MKDKEVLDIVAIGTHTLTPVRLVQGFARLRERNAYVADRVVQIRSRQSLRFVVITPLMDSLYKTT